MTHRPAGHQRQQPAAVAWHSAPAEPGLRPAGGQQYRFGNEARAAARLQPRDINTRYWWQLSTEALQPALGPARHTGDLVHAHLQDMHREARQPAELMLAVSGSMQREQLALLLGIVQQCPFDAVGLVNRSVALGSLYGWPGPPVPPGDTTAPGGDPELSESDGMSSCSAAYPCPAVACCSCRNGWWKSSPPPSSARPGLTRAARPTPSSSCTTPCPTPCANCGSQSETNMEVNGYRARINRGD